MFFKTKKAVLQFTLQDQCLFLQGPVNAQTVPDFLKQWQAHCLKEPVELQSVDWSSVTESDSTGLALMLMLQAKQSAVFSLSNVPPKILTLLHLYDLSDVFTFTPVVNASLGEIS